MATEQKKRVELVDVGELSLQVTGMRMAHANPKNPAMVFPPEISVREVGAAGPSPYRIRMHGLSDAEVRDHVGPGSIFVGTFKAGEERKFLRRDGSEGTEIELYATAPITMKHRAVSPRQAFGIAADDAE